MKRLLIGVLALCLIVSACGSSSVDEKNPKSFKPVTTNKQGSVTFHSCSGLECGKISVPMDYKKTKGRKIAIAIVKKPADVPSKRIGILLVNPGGPGASGIDLVKNAATSIFSQDILDRFDIIGWDPRGVGLSTHVNCGDKLDSLFSGIDYSPDNEQEIQKLKDANAQFGKECEKDDATLLPHLSTIESAQDMDSIRAALGEKQLNYLGFSYGTALGQVYATKFPKNFRTMVIDGVIDMEEKPLDTASEQAVGFEDALNSFFEYCTKHSCTYPQGKDPATQYSNLVAQIDATPIPSTTDPGLSLGPAQFDIGTSYYLYSGVGGWQSLDAALTEVEDNKPDDILTGFSQYVGRDSSGVYDGSYSSFLTIGCADGVIGDADEMIAIADGLKSQAPIFGQSGILLGLPCATWPKAKDAKPFNVSGKGSAPIVVIGTTGDPATPVAWARRAAKELDNGVYVEHRGEGHTSFGQGNTCIDSLVETYFLTAKEPNQKVCSD